MEIKITGRTKNLLATILYIYGINNKAHDNNNGVKKRNKTLAGTGGIRIDSLKDIYNDMAQWNQKKPKNKIKATNVVISFAKNELDFRKPEDVARGVWIAKRFAKRAFPNHACLIAPQNDNQHAISHVHIIVDEINEKSYKALRGNDASVYRLRYVAKQVLKEYNNEPTFNGYDKITSLTHHQANKQPNPEESALLRHLTPVLDDPSITNKSRFRKACRKHGVRASFRRHRRHGKTYHGGLVFKFTDRSKFNRRFIKASQLSQFNNKLSYKNILSMFHKNKHMKAINKSHRNRKYTRKSQPTNIQQNNIKKYSHDDNNGVDGIINVNNHMSYLSPVDNMYLLSDSNAKKEFNLELGLSSHFSPSILNKNRNKSKRVFHIKENDNKVIDNYISLIWIRTRNKINKFKKKMKKAFKLTKNWLINHHLKPRTWGDVVTRIDPTSITMQPSKDINPNSSSTSTASSTPKASNSSSGSTKSSGSESGFDDGGPDL